MGKILLNLRRTLAPTAEPEDQPAMTIDCIDIIHHRPATQVAA